MNIFITTTLKYTSDIYAKLNDYDYKLGSHTMGKVTKLVQLILKYKLLSIIKSLLITIMVTFT